MPLVVDSVRAKGRAGLERGLGEAMLLERGAGGSHHAPACEVS